MFKFPNNKALLLCVLLVLFMTFPACKKDAGELPNFLFVLVDDLGWTDLGCYGSTFYETPNIDRLASQSMLFTNAYASASICSPSRASILTGKYPSRINITDWIPGHDPRDRKLLGPDDLHALPLDEVTLAEVLKENGYNTFFCGKWHLGGEGFLPTDQGFDHNIGGFDKGSPPGGYYSPYDNPKLTDGPDGEYLTDRLTDESIKFLKEQGPSPFFLFLSYYTVHTPIQPCKRHNEKFLAKAERLPGQGEPLLVEEGDGKTVVNQYNADFASMVFALDENIGRLLETLEEVRLYDNTVIIITSDNGGLSTLNASGGRIPPTSVKPLRAGKGWLYEGGIRVPLIIKPGCPGYEDSPVCDVPVTGTDFFPTLLELAGISRIPEIHLDGNSLVPLLNRSGDLPRQEIFWHYPHYHGSAWKPGAALRQGDWKLIEFHETGKAELFDLAKDPGESEDLSDDNPDVVLTLQQILRDLQKATGAKFATANPDWQKTLE
jgi:arylsulfatase A-like enzyme